MILSTIELKGNVIVKKGLLLDGNVLDVRKVLLDGNIRIATGGGGTRYPYYEGEYVVTPKVYEQYLDTDYKVMTDDVTVLEIPYVETSNIYGTTVAIATE